MIGIVVAEEKELEELKRVVSIKEIKKIYEKDFYVGELSNKEVVIVKSNVGKVNASRVCQILIDNFDIKIVINIGVAGSVDNRLNIGDIVVASETLQYDFDTTIFGRKKGEIENIGESIKTNKELLDLFDGVYKGIIVSGDKFVTNIEEKNYIRNTFNAVAVEMEGAAVAQVCYLDNIPFLIIRSITDKLDGGSKVEFEEFLELSSMKVANILKEFIFKYNL